ncbi:MAG: hypothetical protein ACOCQR_03160 [bacterium]
MDEINKIAQKIIEELKKDDFIIQRYDSYSSKSVYLKIDFGVCNSIRISDHTGKGHLKYRYNIQTDIKENRIEDNKFERRYYRADNVKELIKDIKKAKKDKLKKYGKENYEKYMEQNKKDGHKKKGFWQEAIIV